MGRGRRGIRQRHRLALSPKTSDRKGQVFIAVGYGLEGAIPDITANRIIDLEMIPEFKRGGPDAYGWGIRNALDVLGPMASGEIQEYEPGTPLGAAGMIVALLFFGFVFLVPIIVMAGVVGAMQAATTWAPLWL